MNEERVNVGQFQAAVEAIETGEVASLRKLLQDAPSLANARLLDNPRSLLHFVTDWPGHRPERGEMIRLLISAGADPNLRLDGASGETPLHWAASSDDVVAIDALLAGGADVDSGGAVIADGTPLTDAVFFGQLEAADHLVARGATVTLPLAAGMGRRDLMAQFLAKETPSQRVLDEALTFAAIDGQIEAARLLLSYGADINSMPLDQYSARTPLHWAVFRERVEMVRFLVEQGADLDARDEVHRSTPVEWAAYHKLEEVGQYLVSMQSGWHTGAQPGQTLVLQLRRSELARNQAGHALWQSTTTTRSVAATQTAIIICDMWDNHWSRGATVRVDAMAPRMNNVVRAARAKGAHIIHAPSETVDFYATSPARLRMLAVPPVAPPPDQERATPALPIDASDHGSDTGEVETYKAWRRQHPAVDIDQSRDLISDDGREIFSYLVQQGIQQVLIMGVHTNMCVLNRSFGIKQMVKWGVGIALVRDLTDTMYNPAMPPYVSHDEGTHLIVGYIEKFWCPSITSADLLRSSAI